jgi:hypothetical protein
MAFVILGSVVPYPPIPPTVAIFMVIGAIWFATLKRKSRETLRLIANDMED